MIFQLAVIAGAIAAGIVAWKSSRLLSLILFRIAVVDLAREAIGRWVLRPERARLLALVGGDESHRAPFAGAIRVAYSVDQALYLVGPATVAAFAVWTFTRRRRRPLAAVVATWATCSAAVTYLYPQLSGLAWATWQIGPVYRCAHAAAALAAAAAFVLWSRHREYPELRHRVAFRLAGAELLVAFVGPYAWGGAQGVWTRWALAQVIYLVTLAEVGRLCWHTKRAGHNEVE